MMTDEFFIALVTVTILTGGFLLLSICAFRIQAHKVQLNVIVEEIKARRKSAEADLEPPIEVS